MICRSLLADEFWKVLPNWNIPKNKKKHFCVDVVVNHTKFYVETKNTKGESKFGSRN
ncbi:NERD domain-containing protein [Weeksella virosa]|uniref:NERD domain-containing protein n=1 Tax=Weeksella virosa TaxID=1014 RepID=UPI0035D05A16